MLQTNAKYHKIKRVKVREFKAIETRAFAEDYGLVGKLSKAAIVTLRWRFLVRSLFAVVASFGNK